jgi:hypothetical protein
MVRFAVVTTMPTPRLRQRWNSRDRLLRRLSVIALGSAAALSACTGPSVLEPTTVGVVASAERRAGNYIQLTLDGGTSLEIDDKTALRLVGGSEPKPGDLLILGGPDDDIWYAALTRDSDPPVTPCWTAAWFGRAVDGAIQFDNGLRLPTVPDFDGSLATADGRFVDPSHRFCLNERGEVTAYR